MAEYSLNIHPAGFLADYWQRQHLFIAQGMSAFTPPADADELAGLALEPGIDSRIVSCKAGHWQQESGPFTPESYTQLGAWTLLVQGVDLYWDEAAALLAAVAFIPSWRLDDVLMSYATDGGSAGPHYDNYDVFIIQGEGQRRWQIGEFCDSNSELVQNTDLRLLANFSPVAEYLMSTGDVLYVPPGCAHCGTSVGESTSFSIGFRAPRMSDLLARWADNRLTGLEDDLLYVDPKRAQATRSGEITGQDLQRARAQLLNLFDDVDPRWLGEAVTNNHCSDAPATDKASTLESLGTWMSRSPGSRLAWFASEDKLLIFANGATRDVSLALQPLLEALCANQDVALQAALDTHDAARDLLHWLHEEGTLLFYD